MRILGSFGEFLTVFNSQKYNGEGEKGETKVNEGKQKSDGRTSYAGIAGTKCNILKTTPIGNSVLIRRRLILRK